MLFALWLDRLIGWPDWLYKRVSHPVVAIGYLITFCDKMLNRKNWPFMVRRSTGIVTVICVTIITSLLAVIIQNALPEGIAGIIMMSIIAWPFIAAKSLYTHLLAVADPLQKDDIDAARKAVAMIVGRNAETLDKTAIARASLESLAENTSDGVSAPLFWGALFGLPGLVLYKAINTMDSMIGYRNERYGAFGWAAARLDDVANIIPARLTGLCYAILSRKAFANLRIMMRDARHHRSPNAGWPESAFAANLAIRLSGPRLYDGKQSDDAWLNAEGRDPQADDIITGLALYNRLLNVIVCLLMGASFLLYFYGIGS